MTSWVDRSEALKRLGVRAQTLYAYVSRGRIGVRPDPADPRRSLYDAGDLDQLAARRKRGRAARDIAAGALAWGEAAIPTTISTIHHGRLIYRGQDATTLAADATLEAAANLLWEQAAPVRFVAGPESDHGAGPFFALARNIAGTRATVGRSGDALRQDGATAIGWMCDGFGLPADPIPVHLRLARLWAVEGQADLLRRALVLMADHELNASTFAVRVAASTGASIAASLLAGLATLSGPYHGGAGTALAALVEDADRIGSEPALDRWLARGHVLPGFGHVLYPGGDARAGALLDRIAPDPLMARLADAAHQATGQYPNIDFALCALKRALRLPAEAPFVIFALGRSVGWVAHALEQVATGHLIRPRAHYQGTIPKNGETPEG
ncbi:citrate synthase [Sphingomonas sp. MMS24-J13]|uniref:citrate synthase n=1 Tax=Sphingomonas sp. MMS24-J13 TaxID=3238686 RepID=UPI00384C2839